MRIDDLLMPHASIAQRVPALKLRARPHRLRRRAIAAVGLILAVALSGCRGGDGTKSDAGEPDAGFDGGEPQAFRLERLDSRQGVGVMKLLPLREGVLALIERPLHGYWVRILDCQSQPSALSSSRRAAEAPFSRLHLKDGCKSGPTPDRTLLAFDQSGTVRFEYAARPDESILDFAVHASEEVTVVTASLDRFFLVRVGADGDELTRQELQDPEVTSDPHWPAGAEPESVADGLRPSSYEPAEARLVSFDDAVMIALRTRTRSVLAYRYEWRTGEGFTRAWRRLLVPSWRQIIRLPDTATYDTFGQVLLGHTLHLEADPKGRVYIATAVAQDWSAIQRTTWSQVGGHFWLLGGEPPDSTQQLVGVLPQLLTSATLLVALSERGEHRYTQVLNFARAHELYGMRRLDDKLFFLGRTYAEAQDRTEFDAFVAQVDADSGEAQFARVLDLEQGDVFFDIARAGEMLLAVGATNWTQNPTGFSVSSESEMLAAMLRPDTGTLHCRLPLQAGPRHNELRSVIAVPGGPGRQGSFYVGGAENGPSSHTPVDEISSDLYLVRATGEPPCEGAATSGKAASK
jgi:hypothetical protein